MQPLLVLITVFGVFIPALMLPGPDFVAVVRSSMTRGTAAGLATTAGVSLMLGVYAALSLLGLSAILVQYHWLAWGVRIAGGAYLIYLGVRLVLAKPDAATDLAAVDARARTNPFVFGVLVTLTNPKAIVLFASVFATAITPTTPHWLLALMIALVVASSLVWYTLVTLLMSSAPVLRRFSAARHRIEQAAGICFVAIGGKVLADARTPIAP